MAHFSLAFELQRDCIELFDWPLCKVLLMNDRQFPWFILVPKIADVTEFVDLTEQEQQTYWQESILLSHKIKAQFMPDKLNIAALGNMVPQLHIHHIARYKTDLAWPAPVWGKCPAVAYSSDEIKLIRLKMA